MYESGGEIHWRGHLLILFGLMLVGVVAAGFRWHENFMAMPFFLYLGYLIFRAGRRLVHFLQRLARKYR